MRIVSLECLLLLWLVGSPAAWAQPKLPFQLPPKPPSIGKAPAAADLLQKLIENLQSGDESARLDAAEQLPGFGSLAAEKATGALVEALDDESQHVRYAALTALAAIGHDAKDALPKVRQTSDGADSDFERVLAAWTAARITRDAQQLTDLIPMLTKSLSAEDPVVRGQAAAALAELGRVAHAPLTEALADADTRASILIVDVLGRTGARGAVSQIAGQLHDERVALRVSAAEALGRIGPASKTVAPVLRKSLMDDDSSHVRARAARALGRIGEASAENVQALSTAAAGDDDEFVVREALQSLVDLKADNDVILELSAKLLADKRTEAVTAAMTALAQQGEAALPVVEEALQNDSTRYWALLVLPELGPVAKKTVPAIAELLPKATPLQRREILMALAGLGPAASEAVPQVAAQLASDDAGTRYAATFAAGKIGKSNSEVVAALKKNLGDEDSFLRMTSAWALAKLEPDDPFVKLRAVRELGSGLTSDDAELQQAAAQCLADLKPGPAQLPLVLPNIAQAFRSENPLVKQSALDAFAGVLATADVDDLLGKAITNEAVRPMGVSAAGRLGDKAKGVVEELAEALGDRRGAVRRDAALALAAIGPGAAPSVPELQQRLSDEDPDVRRAAAFALGAIGVEAKASTTELRRRLTDSDVQTIAACALARIAPDDSEVARAAVPQLIHDLDADLASERQQAATAVARFGPAASSAEPALRYALEDPDPGVRAAAQQALSAIGDK